MRFVIKVLNLSHIGQVGSFNGLPQKKLCEGKHDAGVRKVVSILYVLSEMVGRLKHSVFYPKTLSICFTLKRFHSRERPVYREVAISFVLFDAFRISH